MTKNDALDFCDKGNHKYREVDVLQSIVKEKDENTYILFQCDECPSKWVKKI